MDLWFATSNPGKLREANAAFSPHGIRVRPVRRALPEPQADTLEEVLRAKLAALPPRSEPQLVEDSGIFLEGLGGFPGVYSAYAYRTLGLSGILRALGRARRGALFRTVAGVRIGQRTWRFVGESRGSIVRRPRGTGGFGYDPIFRPIGNRRTFAEMRPEEKLAVSHRGRAFRAVAEFLSAR